MASEHDDTRLVSSLRTGTRICLLLALPALLAALYYYFVPVTTSTANGGVFGCGSASNPPSEQFPKNVCQNITDINLYRAYTLGALTLLLPLLGFLLFGADKHEQRRQDLDDSGADERDERDGRGVRPGAERRRHAAPAAALPGAAPATERSAEDNRVGSWREDRERGEHLEGGHGYGFVDERPQGEWQGGSDAESAATTAAPAASGERGSTAFAPDERREKRPRRRWEDDEED